ncbi:MAG: biotin--[acetyl-CoA-carboxylase] ligase [Candidatus Gastranaerophilales bacterium]|nr:biotin--[acetyl-CoA-carboxylase] ligase [Candidatus Gastranaerophilales bacterium]
MKQQELYLIEHFEEIDSTNEYALRNLKSLPDRQVIISDMQTNGKGRMNRAWISDKKGNVYLSIVLKPCDKVNKEFPLGGITQYMSVIACKILETYGAAAKIKWPNDVLVDGRKIAGILSQASVRGDNFNGLVLGVGINLNLTEQEIAGINQPATALNLIISAPVDRDTFIKSLLDRFFEGYDTFLATGFPLIKEDYVSRCSFLNKRITLKTHNSLERVTALNMRDDGALIIVDDNMREKVVAAGEIVAEIDDWR